MEYVVIFFLELFILFLLSRSVTRGLSLFFYKLVRREKWAVALMSFIFLPGTIIHEVSHYIAALVLGVKAGKMEFKPEIHGNSVKMGSVSIAETDPFRRFLIGISPVVFGTVTILGLMYFATTYDIFSNLPMTWGVLNMTFVVGNTMYSSKRDMEGAFRLFFVLGVAFLCLVLLFAFTGVSIPDIKVDFLRIERIYEIFAIGWKFLLVPIGVDIVLLGVFKFINR